MKYLKWSGYVLGAIALFFLLTNPSLKDFNDFIETKVVQYKGDIITSRQSNYFFYSVYEYKVIEKKKKGKFTIHEHGYYNAWAKNFYEISKSTIYYDN